MTHQPVHCSAGHEVRSYVGQTQHCLVSPVVTSRQPLQDLPELLPPPGLALLAGQHQVWVEVVRDEGGGQVPEIQLQHRTGSRLETLILGFLYIKKGTRL